MYIDVESSKYYMHIATNSNCFQNYNRSIVQNIVRGVVSSILLKTNCKFFN